MCELVLPYCWSRAGVVVRRGDLRPVELVWDDVQEEERIAGF